MMNFGQGANQLLDGIVREAMASILRFLDSKLSVVVVVYDPAREDSALVWAPKDTDHFALARQVKAASQAGPLGGTEDVVIPS